MELCECKGWVLNDDITLKIDFLLAHHHPNCEKFKTEKFTYLFYYCDGFDAWIPASEKIENVVDVGDFDNDEEREIKFKRVDMTDYEYANMKDE